MAKKLIETALPLADINKETAKSRGASPGHPANLHLWWGRSPMPCLDTLLSAALVDTPDNPEELKERIGRLQKGGYAAFGEKPTVYDPFCGFGGIPLAAQQPGLPVIAGDVNPVAVLLTKAAAEIPTRFMNLPAVNRLSLGNAYRGAAGLAEDVAYYGELLLKRAKEALASLYPDEPEGAPTAWVWARTVQCPNPACGCEMPTVTSFVLCAKPGHEVWAEPVAEDGRIRFALRTGPCPKGKESNKFSAHGAKFTCPCCGTVTPEEYIREQGKQKKFGARLMATVIDTPEGKLFKAPSPAQEDAARVPTPKDLPEGDIPGNAHWFAPPGYGLTAFTDLFTARQLTMLNTFTGLLEEVRNLAASDALAAGMSPEGGPLAEGGAGALAYGQAIGVYLALAVDKMADRNSTACSWNASDGCPRATFGRQAIVMPWNYGETNPFSATWGGFAPALKSVVATIQVLPCGSAVTVYQGDALTAEPPENALICTELPYYDAIGYADLSDYFYIWLRRSLKTVYPDLFAEALTPKAAELTTVGHYFGRDAAACDKAYEEKLAAVLRRLYRAASPDYPALFYFEYHRADAQALEKPDSPPTRWETMLKSLTDAGFTVTALWPIRSEAPSDKADGIRVLIVARKAEKKPPVTRRGFINILKKELPKRLETLFSMGVDAWDKRIAGMGSGLSLFTSMQRVINADGTDMSLRDARLLIAAELDNFLYEPTDSEPSPEPAEDKEE